MPPIRLFIFMKKFSTCQLCSNLLFKTFRLIKFNLTILNYDLTFHRYGTNQQFPLFKKEYVRLYVGIVREAVLAVDKSRYFMVSSPSNGQQSDAEGYVSSHPYDPLYGDGTK